MGLRVVGVLGDAGGDAGLRGALLVEAALQVVILVPLEKGFEEGVFDEVGAVGMIMNPGAA